MYGMMLFAYVLIARQKQIAQESLKIAFGNEKSDKEVHKIVRDCLFSIGRNVMDMFYYLSHQDEVEDSVVIEGYEHVEAALKKGKGVVAVIAHFGHFPLMMMYLARQKGIRTSAIMRYARDKKLENFLSQKRKEMHLNTIFAMPRSKCIKDTLYELKHNGLVFIPLDQNFGSGTGVFVDFFGQKAATATGPVVFARKTGAAVLPMFIYRDEDGKHRIVVEPEYKIEELESDEKTIEVSIADLTHTIEKYVRKYPHEWGWMHRRWKSRPQGETLES